MLSRKQIERLWCVFEGQSSKTTHQLRVVFDMALASACPPPASAPIGPNDEIVTRFCQDLEHAMAPQHITTAHYEKLPRQIIADTFNAIRSSACPPPEGAEVAEIIAHILALMDDADGALDNDVYEQKRAEELDAPDDAEWTVRAGTVRKIEKLFIAISEFRHKHLVSRLSAPPASPRGEEK